MKNLIRDYDFKIIKTIEFTYDCLLSSNIYHIRFSIYDKAIIFCINKCYKATFNILI